jgi:hypothetical protein
MPDLKPTALPALTSLAAGDIVAVVDVSDTTDDAAGSDKQITGANLATSLASLGTFATDAEVTAAVAAHTGDSTAAHAASAISFSPAGTIAGTDVQTAVAEVATDAATALAAHEAAGDPHPGYTTAAELATHAGLTSSVHGISAFGATLVDDASASAARATLGLAAIAASGSATDLSAGTVSTARLGTGTADSSTFLRGDSTWVAPAGGSGVTIGHPLPSGGARVGIPGCGFVTQAQGPVIADRLYYMPFLVQTQITVDAMICDIVGALGTLARLGILAADTAWQPTSVVQDAGTVSTASTGSKTASFTAINLAAGRYLMAFVANAGCTTYNVRATPPFLATWTGGFGTAMNIASLYKAGAGTGALSGAAWDATTFASTPFEFYTTLRITAV